MHTYTTVVDLYQGDSQYQTSKHADVSPYEAELKGGEAQREASHTATRADMAIPVVLED